MTISLNRAQVAASEIIEKIDELMKGRHDSDTTLIHLFEEVGEISREIYGSKIGRSPIDAKNLSGEFADAFLLLAHLANHYGVSLEEAIQQKSAELTERFGINVRIE